MKASPSGSSIANEPSSDTGFRRGGILAAGSLAASGLTTLCSLGATILILRALSKEEAGRFALLVELLYSIGLLASLGQSALQARLYLQQGASRFNWISDARSTVWITVPAVAVTIIAIARPYQLSLFEGGFLFVGAELFILTTCFSAVLGQQRHYVWSSALLRLGNGLLIIPAGLMLFYPKMCRLDLVLMYLVAFLGAVTLLGSALMAKWVPRGGVAITLRQRVSGLVFLVSFLALVVPQRGLIAVAGALLTPVTVASLAALVSILRVFDLVGESTGRVFATEMAQHPMRLNFGLLAAPWLLAGFLVLAVTVGLQPLVHRLYQGRYDTALPFLPWLVIAAGCRLVEIVPRGFLGYLAPAP
ncbi:MAG: hypothetical protein ACJ8M1_10450, partial [Chthoniobacterales bacterium]